MVETIPDGLTARPDGTNEFVNKRWETVSAQDTAVGWMSAVHPEDHQVLLDKGAPARYGRAAEFEARVRSAATGDIGGFWLVAYLCAMRTEISSGGMEVSRTSRIADRLKKTVRSGGSWKPI